MIKFTSRLTKGIGDDKVYSRYARGAWYTKLWVIVTNPKWYWNYRKEANKLKDVDAQLNLFEEGEEEMAGYCGDDLPKLEYPDRDNMTVVSDGKTAKIVRRDKIELCKVVKKELK